MYAAVSGSPFTAAGTLQTFGGIAIDGAGNAWVAASDAITDISAAGAVLSGSSGFQGTGVVTARGIAIDGAGNVWFANSNSFTGVSELVGIAAPVVTPIVANLIAPYSTHASRP